MPTFGDIYAVLTPAQANDGILLNDVALAKVIEPDFLFLVFIAYYPDNDGSPRTVQMFPGNKFDSSAPSGTPKSLSINSSYTRLDVETDDWSCVVCPIGGPFVYSSGLGIYGPAALSDVGFRATASGLNPGPSGNDPQKIVVTGYVSSAVAPEEFDRTLPGGPTDLTVTETVWDEEEQVGTAELSFTYTGDPVDGFFSEYSDDGIDWFYDSSTEGDSRTIRSYTYDKDLVFQIRVSAYNLDPDAASDPSDPVTLSWEDTIITMLGGIDFGGSASFIFSADPSGIYTLVPGKTHDTLYDRIGEEVTSLDVKIPRPFVKTAYFGE
jgi:hypothetical protein